MAVDPAGWWGAPKPVEKPTGGRVVRLLGEDEEDDLPKSAATARRARRQQEGAMPKGIYDRKPKADAPAANDAAAKPRKARRKARSVAVVPEVAAVPLNGSKGRFDVALDLRAGAVTINAENGSLTLAPDEVLALFAFLGRR